MNPYRSRVTTVAALARFLLVALTAIRCTCVTSSRLFWSWLLAGGSANYGGRWWVVQPYSQTGQRGAANPWSAKGAFTPRDFPSSAPARAVRAPRPHQRRLLSAGSAQEL